MTDYIGRDAAIAALTEFCYDQTASKYLSVDDCLVARDAIERATKVLESLPAPDIEPVKHGRWNDWEVFWKECSCCRYRTQKINAREYFFCPNCGCRMGGGADNV